MNRRNEFLLFLGIFISLYFARIYLLSTLRITP